MQQKEPNFLLNKIKEVFFGFAAIGLIIIYLFWLYGMTRMLFRHDDLKYPWNFPDYIAIALLYLTPCGCILYFAQKKQRAFYKTVPAYVMLKDIFAFTFLCCAVSLFVCLLLGGCAL